MAGLQERTTYKLVSFSSGSGRARDALQKKATGGATSKVVKETAGLTRLDLTLKTSISAFIRPLFCYRDPLSLCSKGLSSIYNRVGRKSRRNSR